MERKEKVLIGIITNKDTLPIKVVPYFTVLLYLNIKKCFLVIIFFFHYLTLDCPTECLEALKNKVPHRHMKHIFSVVYATLLMTLNLKPSYLQQVKLWNWKRNFILKKSQLF